MGFNVSTNICPQTKHQNMTVYLLMSMWHNRFLNEVAYRELRQNYTMPAIKAELHKGLHNDLHVCVCLLSQPTISACHGSRLGVG